MYEKMNISECEKKTKTSISKGLTNQEASKRLCANGKNELLGEKNKNIINIFFSQLNDPMIYILMVSIVISLLLKEFGDSLIIIAVILLNGIVGTIQESKAENALLALKQMTHPMCVVKRDGKLLNIYAENLVVGDVVSLESGNKVPADVRLIETKNMSVEEAALTGESIPVMKDSQKICSDKDPLGDKNNMAFMSTTVVSGRGVGIVVATGMNTEVGKIAGMLKKEDPGMTPLQIKLSELGKILGVLTVGLCALMVVVGFFQKRNLYSMLMTGISLAVAAIPEGLPAVVAIVLSLGVQRMAKLNTITRKLSSVETLGAVNVICSDKTGTLTQNKMVVESVYMYDCFFEKNKGLDEMDVLVEGMVLCNDATIDDNELIGDPTEIALIHWGRECGVHKKEINGKYKRLDEIPFDSERKMMSTQHLLKTGLRVYTKGAADEVLSKSRFLYNKGKIIAINDELKMKIIEVSRAMASKGNRVLALAYKDEQKITEMEMIFVGMVAMKDPVRPEAIDAIKKLDGAGIKTIVITGDHKDTAFAVASELGIVKTKEECINGVDFEKISEGNLASEINKYRVFARVSPENKLSIVKKLKENGSVVAMTGDGVNDAPSLKCADIGIAMGITGTDVAKESADMILSDDNFASIEKAVEEGRVIYANIKKSVLFLLSSNLAEIVAMLLSVFIGLPTPMSAIHILWINLITDSVPALALGCDPKENDVMDEKPRKRNESLFYGGMAKFVIFYGVVIGVLCVMSFLCVPFIELLKYQSHISFSDVVRLLKTNEVVLRKAQTVSFTVLSCCELIHAVGMRNIKKTIVRKEFFYNKLMIVALLVGFLLQVMVIEVGFMNNVFETSSLSMGEWFYALGCSLLVMLIHEILCGGKVEKR